MAKETSTIASSPWGVEIVWDPGCLGGPAQTVVDVLRLVNAIAAVQAPDREPPLRWRWVRSDGGRVPRTLLTPSPDNADRGSPWPAREATRRDRRPAAPQVIVLPGWLARDGPEVDRWVERSRAWLPRLRDTVAGGGAVLGVYTGVALLAAAGLLQGRRATAPWPFLAAVLRHAGAAAAGTPTDIQWADNSPGWVGHHPVWTCAAPAAATEALLDLLGQGPHAALAQAARDVLLPSALRQEAAAAHARSAGASLATSRVPAGIVERARHWLVEHLADPFDAAALARAAATSPRTLARHFEATHGLSPHQYLERLRVERACLLLQTTYLTAEEIARASGMPNPGTFRRVFVKHTGQRPGDYRRRYRLRMPRARWASAGAPQPRAGENAQPASLPPAP